MLHAQESEERLLEALIVESDNVYALPAKLTSDDFFVTRHGWIFDAALRIAGRGEKITYTTVGEQLKADGRLDEVGGWPYLTRLINSQEGLFSVMDRSAAFTYGMNIYNKATRRRLLNAASRIAQLAYDESKPIEEVVADCETAVATVSVTSNPNEGTQSIGDIADDVLDDVDQAILNGCSGLKSGIIDLDNLTGGFQPADFIVLAGRPGMGKSALIMSMITHMVKEEKKHGLLLSMEMPKKQCVQRLLCIETGVTVQQQRTGRVKPDEKALLDAQTMVFKKSWSLLIDETPALTLPALRAIAKRYDNQKPLDFVMVDYLQLMAGDGRGNSRAEEVALISGGLKALAKELHIPVIAAAQLNREVEGQKDKRPSLHHLKESGAIEQDADVVILLYRDDYYDENTTQPNVVELDVAKHRNGPTGTIPAYFMKERMLVGNLRRTTVSITHDPKTELPAVESHEELDLPLVYGRD
jgi:replicative DNA helicase